MAYFMSFPKTLILLKLHESFAKFDLHYYKQSFPRYDIPLTALYIKAICARETSNSLLNNAGNLIECKTHIEFTNTYSFTKKNITNCYYLSIYLEVQLKDEISFIYC